MQGLTLSKTPLTSSGSSTKPPLLPLVDSLPCFAGISRKPISTSCKFFCLFISVSLRASKIESLLRGNDKGTYLTGSFCSFSNVCYQLSVIKWNFSLLAALNSLAGIPRRMDTQ